jgi:hypothetical protein
MTRGMVNQTDTEYTINTAWREPHVPRSDESDARTAQLYGNDDPIDDINDEEHNSEPEEGARGDINLPNLSPDARALLDLVTQMRSPASPMPMPSSEQAPRFKGSNLRSFLDDYDMAADGARWTSRQKCKNIYKYCTGSTRNFVRKLEARRDGDWNGTVKALMEFYPPDDKRDKCSRERLERFARKKRTISNKEHFSRYYRHFNKRTHKLYEAVALSERDRLFWKGLPRDLQRSIYYELLARDPRMNRREAPSMRKVREIALLLLDKDSLFAHLTTTSSSAATTGPLDKTRHKKRRSTRSHPRSDSSESSSSEDEEPVPRR